MLIKSEQAFVHIGLEKTGSTFLQDFLQLNSEKLVKIGFCKSMASMGRNHFRLALLGQDKNSVATQVNTYCQIPIDSVEDSNRSLLDLISQAHNSGCRFLASSELISSTVLEMSEIERFKDRLDSIFINVKILLFVRRQEQLLLSRYSTAIIHGRHHMFPNNIDKVSVPPSIDLIAILSKWQRIFGENLLVLPYFEDFERTELVHRFFHSLGVSESELRDFVWPENNSNSSMSATGLETLRRLNQNIEKTPSELQNQIVGYIRDRTQDEGKFGVTESFHEQLVTKFMSVNKRASYFIDPLERENFLIGRSQNSKFSTSPNPDLVEVLLEEIVRLFYKNDSAISKLLLN